MSVLVTHADRPLGRRIVKRLWHEASVGRIVALGEGPAPRAFDAFRAGGRPRLVYERLDHARPRSMSEWFRSRRLRELAPEAVVYVPRHGVAPEGRPVVARVPARTVEARLLLRHVAEPRSVRALVALGSAFVYALAPGNANHLGEDAPLRLDPDVPPALRSWIDSDLLFQAQASDRRRLRVVLLRLPTVVASGGDVYLHPLLEGGSGPRLRPAGFDPLCSVIADHDVARAVLAALASEASGVFHVAGHERVPLSVLGRWTGRPTLPVPGPLLRVAARGASRLGLGAGAALDAPLARYGASLDVGRAARVLGFAPRYRIGLARAGDGALRLEAVPAPA
jgi:nucleoside-diphosphate-sugar epimerase